ncbi:TonB-dependent receptor domain-containing protein [Caulobacter soli]|uniref:TonB-dependent receptor domain-containing protein n=1 Tax=Caulobacter soli TaxID=2708539 RepID=UPI001FE30F35|nr:TonB-dependent receptor [Caulobacter soli]
MKRADRIWRAAVVLGFAAFAATPGEAVAAPGRIRLNLPAKPVRAALLDLALQAGISLGGDLEACRGQAPRLSGVMDLDEALDRILAGSRCAWTRIDAETILIRRTPAKPAPPGPSPATSEAPPSALGEVIVTAQRQPNLPGRTPFALSVVSSEQARRERIYSLGDLDGEVAGMSTTHLGPGRDKVLLRGLSDGAFTGQTQSIVSLYLDEVPVTYNAPDPDLRLADIERVEVLRGPQGTLYGGGSIGGVVRIVTRKPDLDETSVDLMAGLSNTRGGGPGDELEATANIPLISGKAALRAVVYRERQGGYIDNPALGLDGVNHADRHGGRLALRTALGPDWSANMVLTHQSIHNDDTQYSLRRLGPLLRDNRVREPHDNSFDQGSLTLAGEGSWGRLTASASRLGHHFTSRFDASAATGLYGLAEGAAAFDETKRTNLTVAEITYATPQGGRVTGLAGAFVSTGHARTATALGSVDGPDAPLGAVAYAEARDDNIREAALYGELTYALTPHLSLTAGLRWFDYGLDVVSQVTQDDETRDVAGKNDENGLSPKLLLSVSASSDWLVYVQVAEGYRAGGFNTAGRLDLDFDQPGAPTRRYRPDELWNYEVGAKVRWLDDRLQLRAALFQADWTSIQSDQYRADGLPYTANIGAGHNRGLELEAVWRASPRLDLRGAALLSDPSLKRQDPALDGAGVALAGINGVSASFGFDFRQPLNGERTLRAQGRLRYVGHARLSLAPEPAEAAPDYIEGSASLSLETPRWTLGVYVDNLFDRTADSFAFGNPFNPPTDAEMTPLRPRTLGLRLSARF